MFSLKEFIKKGLLDAVAKMADYQVILNATGWYEKGVLTLEDLEEINEAIDESHEEVIEELPVDQTGDEVTQEDIVEEGEE